MPRKPLIRSLAPFAEFLAIAIVTAAVVGTVAAVARGADAQYFPRDLAEGMEGLDVYNLQVALNGDSRTQVAASGPGAPGEESGYFGAKTAAALARYQKIKGISPADGSAEEVTREALNETLAEMVEDDAAAASQVSSGTTQQSSSVDSALAVFPKEVRGFFSGVGTNGQPNKLMLLSSSPATVSVGKRASIFGYGFKAGATYDIVLASTTETIASAKASTTATLEFKVPRVASGAHRVYAKGAEGASNTFTIYVSSGRPPVITSVTPDSISVGDEVVVYGTGLTAEGNTLVTSFGTVENLKMKKVKGKTALVFTSNLGAALPYFIKNGATSTVPVSFSVINARGASEPVLVDVEI